MLIKGLNFSIIRKVYVKAALILSPMLFNLYLNEIPFLLDRKDTDSIALPNGSNLNCLLYADDLVLISHSAKGLQKALSILEKYCNDWLLSVNSKKTKVVIFQKQCRKSFLDQYLIQYKINNDKIEIVDNYSYLLQTVTLETKSNLKDKTNCLLVSLMNSLILSLSLFYGTAQKFGASTIILSLSLFYGTAQKFGASTIKMISTTGRKMTSKRHIYFCKQFLGVNKQCPNVVTRNEHGRLSLKLAIETSII